MMNEWAKVKSLDWGAAPCPRSATSRPCGRARTTSSVTSQAQKDDQQAAGVQGLHLLDQRASRSSGPRPARSRPGPRCGRAPEFQALEVQNIAAQQLDYVKFPPAVPGHRRGHRAHLRAGGQRGRAGQEVAQGGAGRRRLEGQRAARRQQEEVRGVAGDDDDDLGGRLTPGRRSRRRPAATRAGRLREGPGSGGGIVPYLFLAPYLVLFGLFVLAPSVYGIWISLHDWDFLLPGKPFVGLENYLDLFKPGIGDQSSRSGTAMIGHRQSSPSPACRCWWWSRWPWP